MISGTRLGVIVMTTGKTAVGSSPDLAVVEVAAGAEGVVGAGVVVGEEVVGEVQGKVEGEALP